MADDKKVSSYKGFTEAQARANKKYLGKFVDIKVRMLPEQKAAIQAHAEQRGESLNQFLNRAVQETLKRDNET